MIDGGSGSTFYCPYNNVAKLAKKNMGNLSIYHGDNLFLRHTTMVAQEVFLYMVDSVEVSLHTLDGAIVIIRVRHLKEKVRITIPSILRSEATTSTQKIKMAATTLPTHIPYKYYVDLQTKSIIFQFHQSEIIHDHTYHCDKH